MVSSQEVSLFTFLTSSDDVAVSVAVVLVLKSDIDSFWDLPLGDDWEFDWGREDGTPRVFVSATDAHCVSMNVQLAATTFPLAN